ncbi:ABC transporter ATP-binding protein [Andreprevotia chitinilytica]|uniref:ABC transporter ATP-binding protein n=1 Tax=Andreprevotia chitinilytica TaxID=396808 RepID=UPI000556D096|nr:ABC transporter ATP-binding protein [Andreprevotia chitinilytica]
MTAISLQGISKSFRDKRFRKLSALRNISLSVEQGEAFGFIGPNGAGKSTTIKILTGMIRPDAGTAKLFDINCANYQARKSLAYVPENPYLPDYLSPLEILKIGIEMQGLKLDHPEAHCMAWLEQFGIAHVAKKTIRGFSKGMTQRTALAHALALQPQLLILDEPLSGLDPIGRRDVVDILMAFRQRGGTIFFSSHVLHDVERLADRFGLIHKGELRTVRSPVELVADGGLVQIRSEGNTPLAEMQADVGGRWWIEVEPGDVWLTLQKIQAAGHHLIEVKPGLSLERAFMTVVKESSIADV